MGNLLQYFGDEMVDAVWTQYADGLYADGVWAPGAPTVTPVRVVALQPLSYRALMRLPQGECAQDWATTYCAERVDTREGAHKADLLTVDGVDYSVEAAGIWDSAGGFRSLTLKRVRP